MISVLLNVILIRIIRDHIVLQQRLENICIQMKT